MRSLITKSLTSSIIFRNDCINNSAPRTHPNDKLRYIPKSGISRDHTRTGSRRSRCLGGVAEVRPCETGCYRRCRIRNTRILRICCMTKKTKNIRFISRASLITCESRKYPCHPPPPPPPY